MRGANEAGPIEEAALAEAAGPLFSSELAPASLGGFGATRVPVYLGQRIPKTNPTAATMPTRVHCGRSLSGAGISTERGVSRRAMKLHCPLAQAFENGPILGRPVVD
jgi:hypothetical protein